MLLDALAHVLDALNDNSTPALNTERSIPPAWPSAGSPPDVAP